MRDKPAENISAESSKGRGGDFWAFLGYPPLYILAGSGLAFAFEAVRANFFSGLLVLGGLICAYAVAAKDAPDGREVVGDNCYFIGFVFTLVVISASIYLDRGPEAGDFDRLLGSVSVALSTSIVGMFLRFVLNHGAKEPGQEIEDRIRKVAQEVDRLELALGDTVAVTVDYNAKLAEETEVIGKRLNEVLAGLVGDMAARLYDALSQLGVENVQGEIRRAVDAHVGAMSLSASSLEQTGRKVGAIAEELEKAAGALQASSAAVRSALQQAEWEKAGEQLSGFADKAAAAGTTLGKVMEDGDKMARSMAESVGRLDEAREAYRKAMAAASADLDELAAIREQYRKRFDETAVQSLEETHRLYARLIDGAAIAIASMDELRKVMRQHAPPGDGRERQPDGE